MRVVQHEIVRDGDDTKFKIHVQEREYPGENQGRHSKLCEMCGFSTYPECKKYCQNENGSRG